MNEYKNLNLEVGETYTFFGDVQYDSEYFEKVKYFEPYTHIPIFVTKLKAIKTGETKVIADKWFIEGSDINCWPSKTIYEVTISE